MEELRRIAYSVVARACGFGALAIFCLMIGLSYDVRLALKSGAILTTLMTVILLAKAWEANFKPYRRTELWLYVPDHLRPPSETAQWAASTVLREAYLRFAYWTALIAVTMATLAFGLGLVAAVFPS
jgi:hypothetical protein